MVFSSPRFLVFLAALLALLAIPLPRDVKKRVLTVASCLFYAAWDYRYLSLLLVISVVDFVAAARIAATSVTRTKRAWLLASIVSNLGILAYFKYCNFFVENANALLGSVGVRIHALDVLLPAGISFYTFKTMSYTIDVYRGHLQPCRSWLDYAMFITFFPELIAGPIVRASVFLPQMDRQPGPSLGRFAVGGGIFLQGLTKKLLIADRMAAIADPVFADPLAWSTPNVWIGLLAYTIQIYCDFSGYSDMAIGTAKMIGYDLPENFAMPYLASSITEFWRRWHITLSTWLRDYLYIPLGGNRQGTLQTHRNLMLTMLLGGLWHGASWNFVAWGALHGIGLVAHKLWTERVSPGWRLPRPLGWAMTLGFVVLTWVPFRSPSWENTVLLFDRLFGVSGVSGAVWNPEWFWFGLCLVVAGHAIGAAIAADPRELRFSAHVQEVLRRLGWIVEKDRISGLIAWPAFPRPAGVFVLSVWLLALFGLAPTQTTAFIYFQF